MDKRGNLMMNILFFLIGLAVLVIFISPMKSFIDIAQQSDNLNCAGYVHNGNVGDTLSYNSSLNTDTISCLGIKAYLPYLIFVFLVGGVAKIIYERVDNPLADTQANYGGY